MQEELQLASKLPGAHPKIGWHRKASYLIASRKQIGVRRTGNDKTHSSTWVTSGTHTFPGVYSHLESIKTVNHSLSHSPPYLIISGNVLTDTPRALLYYDLGISQTNHLNSEK